MEKNLKKRAKAEVRKQVEFDRKKSLIDACVKRITKLKSQLENEYRELDKILGIPDLEDRLASSEDILGCKVSAYPIDDEQSQLMERMNRKREMLLVQERHNEYLKKKKILKELEKKDGRKKSKHNRVKSDQHSSSEESEHFSDSNVLEYVESDAHDSASEKSDGSNSSKASKHSDGSDDSGKNVKPPSVLNSSRTKPRDDDKRLSQLSRRRTKLTRRND